MTTAALSFGCALLAFSPSLCLLLILAYRKPQLIIVVTTSAFAFLLSTLLSSLLWLPVPSSQRDNPFILIFPGVFCQALFRCGFVWVYHRVERVIEQSIRKHERQEAEDAAAAAASAGSRPSENGNGNAPELPNLTESAKLRLELNDWACGIAAGTGFGGMHAVLLYGTLLASESGKLGTLYQPSCSVMPSLVNSAIMAFLFTVLDVVLMLITFYGMRRRKSGEGELDIADGGGMAGVGRPIPGGPMTQPSRFVDRMRSGNASLVAAFIIHLAAAFATTPNATDDGCLVALPLLSAVVVATVGVFAAGISRRFLPENQRRRLGLLGRNEEDVNYHMD